MLRSAVKGAASASVMLRIGAQGTIALVTPRPQGREGRLSDPFFLELLAGVGEAAGIESRTDACFSFRTAREMLVIMKTAARPVVTRERRVAEPRGPKAA